MRLTRAGTRGRRPYLRTRTSRFTSARLRARTLRARGTSTLARWRTTQSTRRKPGPHSAVSCSGRHLWQSVSVNPPSTPFYVFLKSRLIVLTANNNFHKSIKAALSVGEPPQPIPQSATLPTHTSTHITGPVVTPILRKPIIPFDLPVSLPSSLP